MFVNLKRKETQRIVVFLAVVSLLCIIGLILSNLRSTTSSKQNPVLTDSGVLSKYYWGSKVDKAIPTTNALATFSYTEREAGDLTYISDASGVRLAPTFPVLGDGSTVMNWDVTGFDFSKDCVLKATYFRYNNTVYFGVGGSGPFSNGFASTNNSIVFVLEKTNLSGFRNNGNTVGAVTSTANTDYVDYSNYLMGISIELRTFANGRKIIMYHGNHGFVLNAYNISGWTPGGSHMCVGVDFLNLESQDMRLSYISLKNIPAQQQGIYCWDAAADGEPVSDAVATVSYTTNDAGYPKFTDASLGMQLTRSVTSKNAQIHWELASFDFGDKDFRLTWTFDQSHAETTGQGISFGIGGSAAFSSTYNTTNGGLSFRNQTANRESVWYINGVQQGDFLPYQELGLLANFNKRNILCVLEVRTYDGKRRATVFYGMSGFVHNAIDISSWTPAGRFFFIGAQNGSAAANAGENYVRFCSLEYI